ncbi:baseplate J/gp47 family protein [Maridesulfovibrio sp.]|uniref:baseplate assembly protein n=1 Tax=Maridesulfovibrio sp. TaxID=2795000 RepID=UPI002A18847F|nr:baseplate J/gp47 family protein [Maridesulfovibrio sp.]
MSGFVSIDLSKVPLPDVVETLETETIIQEVLEDYQSAYPEYTAFVESDPIQKLLETAAAREINLRQRVNDAARGCMVATACGADLDNLGALAPVERKLLDAGDSEARPVVPPTYEGDEEFRARVQLAPEGFSTAGPDGAYKFFALTVAAVRDAAPLKVAPGYVDVYVLGREGNGEPDSATLAAVDSAVNDREIRPLTDNVTVKAAEIVSYEVNAKLYIQSGPAPSAVVDAAQQAVADYVAARHVLGGAVPLSGIYAALHVEGVARVELHSPVADLAMEKWQAAYCTAVSVEVG